MLACGRKRHIQINCTLCSQRWRASLAGVPAAGRLNNSCYPGYNFDMGLPTDNRRYSIQEYLAFELAATEKHEFHDGIILDMSGAPCYIEEAADFTLESGGTLEASLIIVNLIRELSTALKGKPCRLAESNLRVRIARQNRYLYPDSLIFCGPPEFDSLDGKRHTLVNPRVIIEVLSPSTEAYDRGEKFASYREIESLEEYIMITQDRPSVESWLRKPTGDWSIESSTVMQSTAQVRCLGIQLPLTEIYAGVEWPEGN